MENFTDLFGDDLTGLDGLGDLGNFSGGAPGGAAPGAPQQAPPGQPQQPPTSESDPSMDPYSQYPPQPGGTGPPGGPQGAPGGPGGPQGAPMNNYGQYRGMTPNSASHYQVLYFVNCQIIDCKCLQATVVEKNQL